MFMLYDELPLVSRVGTSLLNFKHKQQYLWNCSCPICGDVSSDGRRRKARFFIYRPANANQLNVKCHKCGYSHSFRTLLKDNYPELYKELLMAGYKQQPTQDIQIEPIRDNKPILVDSVLDGLKKCDSIKDTHPVAKFLNARLIPRDKWNLLYYTTQFKKYCNQIIPAKFASVENDCPRLVIPYFDLHGRVHTFVGRSFGNEEPRYITIKLADTDRIFGLERLDFSKKVYVVEGAIDSLFLPNCIAVSGSSFDCDTTRSLKSVITIIPDNEPRSKEITAIIKKHIKLGYKVCMLPHHVQTKDINEHIKFGYTSERLVDIIEQNTFQGASALARFSQWSLVNK